MIRNAYLILIHEYTGVLEKLLKLLDDDNNGIYIHIDKRAKDIDRQHIINQVKKSHIQIYSRYKVYWSTNSITLAQLYLLKNAVEGDYDYYHILSGADFPIKSKDEINNFLNANKGCEFIHFGTEQYQKDIECRYEKYHFFSKQLGRNRDKKFWLDAETYSLAIQRRLHIDRKKKLGFKVYGGANWCSITDNLAKYAVNNYRKYSKAFRLSQNSDELFIQTIVMDSPYKENLYVKGFDNDYKACLRYIDWNRGTPYVFKLDDYDELMQTGKECLFARKFDDKKDSEIVEKIYVGQTNNRN
jgi:hypothetical protein